MLTPKDPNDEKNVIMEIRAGAGGDEAAIFAGDLYRMYLRYCEAHSFKTDLMSENRSDNGGYKEVIFEIKGEMPYATFKFESGVHRVQRVPATESQGRIHTSTATVAVLPEAEETDIEINATTCGSTSSAPVAMAAKASTRPTRPCVSLTCRPG